MIRYLLQILRIVQAWNKIKQSTQIMAEEFYFQWQNEVLRTTIYPRLEVMLTNFLVYYKEIDLWAENKNKDIASEIQDYHARKKLIVEQAARAYYDYKKY